MAVNVEIRPATLADAAVLAPIMREADRREVWASSMLTPAEALETSLRVSTHAWSGFADGELVMMWGVSPLSLLGSIGTPWMLAADSLMDHQRAFLRRCPPYVAEMQACYTTLTNWVDARNHTSIKWLRWLGFEIEPAQPYGFQGLPFHRFIRRA